MHPAPDPLLDQVVAGQWRVREVLSPTEQGAAFRVEGLDDGRAARLELWDPRQIEQRGELARFERQARVLSRLRHERCLSLLAFGTHEGRPFLVTELPGDRTLRDEIGKAELTVPRALAIGIQICEALRHLHGHGVVHRALLPENVWLTPSSAGDLVKLGLPRVGGIEGGAAAPGDRLYRPPELSRGRPDERADLYAAGMLLYVMCAGREPAAEVAAAPARRATVPPLRAFSPDRAISEGVERVILRAVAPSPDVRFRDADELMAALETAGARPVASKPTPSLAARVRPALIVAGLAMAAVLGAGVLRAGGGAAPDAPPAIPGASPAAPSVSPAPGVSPAPSVLPATPSAKPPNAPPKPPIERPPVRRAPAAPPPVELARATAPVAEPKVAAPAVASPPGSVSRDEQSEIWALLDSGRVDEGAARIRQLIARNPQAAWPQFALGVVHYRRYWRREAVKQWDLALARDRQIRNDPQFGAYLCFMLDDAWQAAGADRILERLGAEAVPLLDQCIASAKTPRLRAQATRALDRVRRADGRATN